MDIPNFKDVASASKQVATYSAMNPILWKTVICSPIAMVCSVLAPNPLNYFFFVLACVPIIIGSWGFVFFAKNDPNRLQSERHLQNMTVLSRLGSSESGQKVEIVIPDSMKLEGNPSQEHGEGK